MRSLRFVPGGGFLSSHAAAAPWFVVFEDEGSTGFFYACDQRLLADTTAEDKGALDEAAVLDSMLVYNVATLQEKDRERLVSIDWSRDGQQAVLYLDGTPQALVDFAARESYCRSNFPNFMEASGDVWRAHTHAWSDAAMERFDAALYA